MHAGSAGGESPAEYSDYPFHVRHSGMTGPSHSSTTPSALFECVNNGTDTRKPKNLSPGHNKVPTTFFKPEGSLSLLYEPPVLHMRDIGSKSVRLWHSCNPPPPFTRLLVAMCFPHAVTLKRHLLFCLFFSSVLHTRCHDLV
jgi:hypothetical protein